MMAGDVEGCVPHDTPKAGGVVYFNFPMICFDLPYDDRRRQPSWVEKGTVDHVQQLTCDGTTCIHFAETCDRAGEPLTYTERWADTSMLHRALRKHKLACWMLSAERDVNFVVQAANTLREIHVASEVQGTQYLLALAAFCGFLHKAHAAGIAHKGGLVWRSVSCTGPDSDEQFDFKILRVSNFYHTDDQTVLIEDFGSIVTVLYYFAGITARGEYNQLRIARVKQEIVNTERFDDKYTYAFHLQSLADRLQQCANMRFDS